MDIAISRDRNIRTCTLRWGGKKSEFPCLLDVRHAVVFLATTPSAPSASHQHDVQIAGITPRGAHVSRGVVVVSECPTQL